MQERENILRIFKETREAVELGDSATIKNLSNQTNNTASLTQDPDNIAAAVIVYSLSKIIERNDYKKFPGWKKFYKIYLSCIDGIINSIEERDDKSYRHYIRSLRQAIERLSGKLKNYIQDVFRKASINKASKIYEHGISMEKTASLLGITLFELASYAGQKKEVEVPSTKTIDIKTRISLAMNFFR